MKTIYQDSKGRYIEGKRNTRYYEQGCAHCGDLFFPNRKGQKYCSQSCNVKACQSRNGYELGTAVKKNNTTEELEELKEMVSKLSKQVLGINVEGMKSTLAANAIYDAGKGVAKAMGFKTELEKSVGKIEESIKYIQEHLHYQTRKIQELPSPDTKKLPAPQEPKLPPKQLRETGNEITVIDGGGANGGERLVIMKEYLYGTDRYYKPIDEQKRPSNNADYLIL